MPLLLQRDSRPIQAERGAAGPPLPPRTELGFRTQERESRGGEIWRSAARRSGPQAAQAEEGYGERTARQQQGRRPSGRAPGSRSSSSREEAGCGRRPPGRAPAGARRLQPAAWWCSAEEQGIRSGRGRG
ncbi:uncharacterized protein [Zea mays]|uniref:Uncharacterized protein n=1 Tax=Zea mays TaxID=4577 RepID=C0PP80_MAIZE|nr:uncharacterized protein LOC103646194 [Zea mays]ACN36996.1 unknown [Zea mays]|eukprot:XP_008669137.1 uncharacterized protein LOC103646194 [Zea mays]